MGNSTKDAMILHGNQISLIMEASLNKPEGEEAPLTLFGKYSRFKFTIINKKSAGKKSFVTANIPPEDLRGIEELMKIALAKYLEKKDSSNDSATVSSAYTELFGMGKMKGKSPAQVLLDGGSESDLLEQKEFLQKNADRFPANKKMIAAIDEAISLYRAGKLSSEDAKTTSSSGSGGMLVYNVPIKIPGKQNAQGLYFIYKVQIGCDYTKDTYPWFIKITNAYAPVNIDANGTRNALMNQAQEVSSETFNMTTSTMYSLLERMQENKKIFLDYYGGELYEKAQVVK